MRSLKFVGIFVFLALSISGQESQGRSSDKVFDLTTHSKSLDVTEAKADEAPPLTPKDSEDRLDSDSGRDQVSPAAEHQDNTVSEHLGPQKI